MRANRLINLAAALLLVPVATSCVAMAVGAGAGFLVSQELLNNEKIVWRVERDVDEVWATAQSLMADICERPPAVVEFPRTLTGRFQGADVKIVIEANDYLKTDVTVEAREYGARTGTKAKRVLDMLLERLPKA